MDAVEDSLMVLDIKYWENANNKEDRIIDKQLASFLGKDYFVRIPTEGKGDIPTIPFPYYHVCSKAKCRLLFDIRKKFNMNSYLKQGPLCPKCSSKVYPARFLLSCENNHLEDFPWHWWSHGRKDKEYKKCSGELTLFSIGGSSGLESLRVKCSCQEKSYSLIGAMTENNFDEYECNGHHPQKLEFEKAGCKKKVSPLQRGASNVYFPAIRSAITMREESGTNKRLTDLFFDKKEKIEEWISLEVLHKAFNEQLYLNEFKKEGLNTYEEFLKEWTSFISLHSKTNEVTYSEIKKLEYERFTSFEGRCRIPEDKPEFEAEKQVIPYDLKPFFESITLVHRLKEIMVLLGFTRNDSPEPEIKQPDIIWLGSKGDDRDEKWLPAVEIYGEGIFLEINQQALSSWMSKNNVMGASQKYTDIHGEWIKKKGWHLKADHGQEDKDEKEGIRAQNAAYVMLHTLSHLIIKQLSLTSGYSSVAIKERIYCDHNMAGILIYTGSLDQEGSLGGLVEMGTIDKFRRILKLALEEATFCTNDPVCSSMNIDEEEDLNGCSCFACSMIAETSCENGNRLLDRSLLIPLSDREETAFFKGIVP
ncbi:DUF1998 domain-containing protein [Saccharibacillus brassicae]